MILTPESQLSKIGNVIHLCLGILENCIEYRTCNESFIYETWTLHHFASNNLRHPAYLNILHPFLYQKWSNHLSPHTSSSSASEWLRHMVSSQIDHPTSISLPYLPSISAMVFDGVWCNIAKANQESLVVQRKLGDLLGCRGAIIFHLLISNIMSLNSIIEG